jgi:hypothetical protein
MLLLLVKRQQIELSFLGERNQQMAEVEKLPRAS